METINDFAKNLQNADILWTEATDGDATYEAVFKGEPVKLRLNDFPDEVAYTLFVKGEEFDLEERPKGWRLAPAKQG